jgi:hypothetical protein
VDADKRDDDCVMCYKRVTMDYMTKLSMTKLIRSGPMVIFWGVRKRTLHVPPLLLRSNALVACVGLSWVLSIGSAVTLRLVSPFLSSFFGQLLFHKLLHLSQLRTLPWDKPAESPRTEGSWYWLAFQGF